MAAITATKETTIVWASADDQNGDQALVDERSAKLTELALAGKTDANGNMISPTTTTRRWVDQESADEYIAYITALAAKYNKTIVSATVADYVPVIIYE